MARESQAQKRQRALEVFERLDRALPGARIQLNHETPLQLLISVILSAQCTDERVNLVTPALFARYPDVKSLAAADLAEVESLVRTCGLFRSKAKNLIAMAQALIERHGGDVPGARSALSELPGVGTKTAGVVAITLGTDDAFPVDTHVRRIANRLGFTRAEDPDRIERDLQQLVPKRWWAKGHQLLIWHGRRTCEARSPKCSTCPLEALCPKVGVRAADRQLL